MADVRTVLPVEDHDRLRSRLGRVALTYLLAVLMSGLVAYVGIDLLATGGGGLAVPWMIVGSGGAVGGMGMIAAALYARAGVRSPDVDRVRLNGAVLLARSGRLLMLAAALGAAVAAVLLAPTGVDRGFTIGVGAGLAGLLALFALLSVDITRAVAPTRTP